MLWPLIILSIATAGRGESARAPKAAARLMVQVRGPQSLLDARRLAAELRYEEAVVEYQRYLGDASRPPSERAEALFELGFIHSVLGDDVNARARAMAALELNPELQLPANAPTRQQQFLQAMRSEFTRRTRISVMPRAEDDPPQRVRAQLSGSRREVQRVLLRHGLSPQGPYYATVMRCEAEACLGDIPPPTNSASFTAFYFLEALDASGRTVAQAASPREPLRLSVVGRQSWYESPWVWGAGGAAAVAVAGVVFLLAPPPPR